MRINALLKAVILATTLLAGCHLVFPFDPVSRDSGVDAAQDILRADKAMPEGPVEDLTAVEVQVPPVDATVPDAQVPDAGSGGNHVWSKSLGAGASEFVYGIALDKGGNIFLAGYFTGTTNLGGSSLTSMGNDIFLASYTPDGQHRWSKSFGGSGDHRGLAVAVDGPGNVYLVGHFDTILNLGGQTLSTKGADDLFVASFDSGGNHRWSSRYGSTGGDQATGVATDPAGNVYVTGAYTGPVGFGGPLEPPRGGLDIFVASYGSSGLYRWSTSAGSVKTDRGLAVATDSAGNVYVTGDFHETITFASNTLTSAGAEDIFLVSFGSLGQHRWSNSFGGTAVDQGLGVAAGGGSVYVTGHFKTTVIFGSTAHSTTGGSDVFLAGFDQLGKYQWSQTFGSKFADYGYGVAASPKGDVAITGYISAGANFGGGTLPHAGSHDIFIASYTALGQHRFSKSYGDTQSDHGRAVAFDASGSLLATGYFFGNVNFGGKLLSGKGSWDTFLLKLSP